MVDYESIEIRILSDGRICLHGLSEDLLEVAYSVCPNDDWLAKRIDMLREVRSARDKMATTKGLEDVTRKADW